MLATRAIPQSCTSSLRNPIIRASISTSAASRSFQLQSWQQRESLSPQRLIRNFSSTGRDMSLDSYLITPAQLHEALKAAPPTRLSSFPSSSSSSSSSRIIPLCASWFLPNDPQKRTGQLDFSQSRIPQARFFDLDAVKDHDSPYPHMLPTVETFAAAMSELGINKGDRVVVYDSADLGLFSAPRVAWTLKVFGHDKVHVLNNYKLWKQQGYPVETGPVKEEAQERTKYPVPTFCTSRIIAFREVKDIAKAHLNGGSKEKSQIIDLRSRGRFEGTAPEPRPGLPSGHMPGAINIPLASLLNGETGALKDPEELKRVFEEAGVDSDRPIISTCGTGVMAAACDLALEMAEVGVPAARRVYDGSWTEYASRVEKNEGLIVDAH